MKEKVSFSSLNFSESIYAIVFTLCILLCNPMHIIWYLLVALYGYVWRDCIHILIYKNYIIYKDIYLHSSIMPVFFKCLNTHTTALTYMYIYEFLLVFSAFQVWSASLRCCKISHLLNQYAVESLFLHKIA